MSDFINFDYTIINNLPELLALLHKENIPKNHYWRYIDMYQERKAREKGIPLYGLFELTPLCNLDCKMCYVHIHKNQLNGAKLLSVEWWKDIISQANSLGMMNAALTGGECLLFPEFDQLYMFLRSLGIRTSIKTNGLLLNKERIAFFDKYPPRDITVSLYGSSNEAYKKVTGHAVFDIVYKNLLRLKEVDYPIRIAITPSRYMYDDIKSIIKLVNHLNMPYSVNVALFPPRKETGNKIEDLSNREYIDIYKMRITKDSSFFTPVEETELPDYSRSGECPEFGVNCGAGRSSFTVNWDGSMLGCNNLNALKIDLCEKTFKTAWEQIYLDAISFPRPVECNNCAYDKVCFNCIAYRNLNTEKGHCNPDICERTKQLVKEGIYSL